jgi:cyclophilin family peptidyl-prolyl cis-trans isomerase
MRHSLTLVLLLTLALSAAFASGCIWTAPDPTHTPTTQDAEKEPPSVETTFPDMPAQPADRNQMFKEPPPMVIDPARTYVVTIVTDKGEIECRLFADQAPQTVNNFVYLSQAGFYDGLTFHRVVPGFVIQGGDPLGNGTGSPGYTIPAEIGQPHPKGALATARLSDQVNPERASSGSQFYITLDATPHLDGGYTVFGQVVEGMSVVEAIAVGDVIQEIVIAEE